MAASTSPHGRSTSLNCGSTSLHGGNTIPHGGSTSLNCGSTSLHGGSTSPHGGSTSLNCGSTSLHGGSTFLSLPSSKIEHEHKATKRCIYYFTFNCGHPRLWTLESIRFANNRVEMKKSYVIFPNSSIIQLFVITQDLKQQ